MKIWNDGWLATQRQHSFYKNGDTYLPLYEAKMFHQFNHRGQLDMKIMS